MHIDINVNTLSSSEKYWLNDVTRLSSSLRKCFSDWNIVLHYSGKVEPTPEEVDILSCDNQNIDLGYFGRFITHNLGQEHFILARVVMTLDTYRKYQTNLDNLGNQSIGEYLLFHDPMYRSGFSVRKINKGDLAYIHSINSDIIKASTPSELLTRFSLFKNRNDRESQIIVNEYFLKDLSDYGC